MSIWDTRIKSTKGFRLVWQDSAYESAVSLHYIRWLAITWSFHAVFMMLNTLSLEQWDSSDGPNPCLTFRIELHRYCSPPLQNYHVAGHVIIAPKRWVLKLLFWLVPSCKSNCNFYFNDGIIFSRRRQRSWKQWKMRNLADNCSKRGHVRFYYRKHKLRHRGNALGDKTQFIFQMIEENMSSARIAQIQTMNRLKKHKKK